jgi:hypothetical protein
MDYAFTDFHILHVGTSYHFVREFIQEGFIKIEFVRSKTIDSEFLTKNASQEFNERHKDIFGRRWRLQYCLIVIG